MTTQPDQTTGADPLATADPSTDTPATTDQPTTAQPSDPVNETAAPPAPDQGMAQQIAELQQVIAQMQAASGQPVTISGVTAANPAPAPAGTNGAPAHVLGVDLDTLESPIVRYVTTNVQGTQLSGYGLVVDRTETADGTPAVVVARLDLVGTLTGDEIVDVDQSSAVHDQQQQSG